MPELTWISTCKFVFKELRTNNDYADVYVDYRTNFKNSGKRCKKILVWVPTISDNVERDTCDCFIRSSILALDIPHEYIQYNRKIMIYPLNAKIFMVFEKYKGEGNYYPLEIYIHKNWTEYHFTDVEISTTALLQSYSEVSNLQTILNPVFCDLQRNNQTYTNIVNCSRQDHFSHLCRIILRRAMYSTEIFLSPNGYISNNQVSVVVILRTEDDQRK